MTIHRALQDSYYAFFGAIKRVAGSWFVGLAARFTFLAVLFLYFFNSWKTKTGEGPLGAFSVSDNAYFQIAPWAVEAANGEISRIGFLNDIIVYTGTFAELLLPVLIVIGLCTRAAALAMIAFVAVQSFVDIRHHGVDAQTAGAWFDRFPDSLIADQRLLWVFLLLMLAINGAGAISLDRLFARRQI